jgi:hypothetical protein
VGVTRYMLFQRQSKLKNRICYHILMAFNRGYGA